MSMEFIERIDVGSGGQAEIEFTSIPQTYTDLMILISHRSEGSTIGQQVVFQFNSSATGYSRVLLFGNGSIRSSSSGSGETHSRFMFSQWSGSTANTFNNAQLYIPNYTSSNAKSTSSDHTTENNATASYQGIYANYWSGTDAITSIKLYDLSLADFAEYSSATLYGITAGSSGGVTVS